MSTTPSPNGQPGTPPTPDATATTARPEVNIPVFAGSAAGILALAIWALVAPEHAASVLGTVVGWISTGFGWFYIALATVILVFVIYLGISRFGKIRLGPAHSRPQYSTFSWAAMLFAAGIGTDLMFFSVAEPVTQYLHPPAGQGGTVEAAREGAVWTMFHYGISGWAMYSLMGIALGFCAYRLHLPLAVRSALYPIFGRRVDGGLGRTVDAAAVLGTIFGVATSLGIGVVQLNVGLGELFGAEQGIGWQVALIVLAVAMAAISATTGVDKGIRFLSQLNVLLAIGLAAWVLITGRTMFLLNALVMNVGDFVTDFPGMTMDTFAYDQPTDWLSAWTLFFWAWWVAWASFVGMFLARISRGRTIRQFVTGTLIIPFSYIVMWVSIFGNSAISRIRNGDQQFGEMTVNRPELGFYTLLQDYPGALFIAGVATFVGLLFYVTSADSGALVMANLTSKLPTVHDDAAAWMRIVWAAVTGLLTAAVLVVGGIPALQNATIIMGLPFAFVMVLVMLGLYRALSTEQQRYDASKDSLPRILSGRGLAQDGQLARSWRARVGRVTQFPDVPQVEAALTTMVEPALKDVMEELEKNGVPATVTRGPATEVLDTGDEVPDNVQLRVPVSDDQQFLYRVEVTEVSVPIFGVRMVQGRSRYARLVVHLAEGGQPYDVMGWSQEQLIHDVLDKYERHLEFLRLTTAAPAVTLD
jgi:choline/glycine/proline betaine transport protein